MRMHEKVAVVTGGAQGIGAGCVKILAREGAHVAILDVNREAASSLIDEINSAGLGRAFFVPCDVTQREELREAIDESSRAWGRIDCLVNNAGYHPPATSLETSTPELLRETFAINFDSTFFACQFALPHLRSSRGTIINISSMTAVLGQKDSTAYAATKGAQLSFTKALALELGPEGIRVNAVLPSNVDTPMMHRWANTLDNPESALQQIAELQVLGRMASIEEIGRVVLFLASEDSSFITGQGIEVDGGASLDY
ncbi:SDR family NAD(P)-dependent oxidoreductase [Bremerella sp. JC817]|uniref:SDR family NAD(P)-dependent oxidoreductase n=1 Tax=Bremerella sp. JC817 TaxID=3231756 RepID=UPI00345945F3